MRAQVLAQIVGVVRNGKLNLGGTSGPSGGAGTPAGGFDGLLIQTAVAYDTTEASASTGSSSLLDNLNHIRQRLSDLETIGYLSSMDFYQGVTSGSAFVGSGSILALDDYHTVEVAGGVAFISFKSSYLLPSPVTKGDLLVSTGSTWELLPVGSNDEIIIADDTQDLGMRWGAVPSAGSGITNYTCIQDQKSAATAGGTFTQGAWRTRDINTIQSDSGSLVVSLSSNEFSLNPGTYIAQVTAPAWDVQGHQARLYDVTGGSVILYGTGEWSYEAASNASAQTRSHIRGQFALYQQSALRVEHYCELTKATSGFGLPANFGGISVYTIVELWKVG